MIKTLLLTEIRVSELVNIKIDEVNLSFYSIRISKGKGGSSRIVPFSPNFKEILAFHIKKYKKENREYLVESNFRKNYTDRGIRKILMRYTNLASIKRSMSPHKLRHFLFTCMKKKGVDDALIQPFSGHEKRASLEIYSKLSLADAQEKYNEIIGAVGGLSISNFVSRSNFLSSRPILIANRFLICLISDQGFTFCRLVKAGLN